jgi:predicted signal transduction protein with EAL and GGDEF domain
MTTLNLKPRIVLALIPAIVFPLWIIASLAYNELQRSHQEKALDEITDALDSADLLLKQKLNNAKDNLNLLSKSHLLRQYFFIQDEEKRYHLMYRSILELFKSYQLNNPGYFEIRLLNSQGIEEVRLAYSGVNNQNDNESEQIWFQKLTSLPVGRSSTQLLLHDDTNERCLLFSRAIPITTYTDWQTRTNQDVGGYLTITLKLEEIQQALEQYRIGKDGFLVLLDAQAKPVYTPANASRYFKNLSSTTHQQYALSSKAVFRYHQPGSEASFLIRSVEISEDLKLMAIWPEIESTTALRELASKIAWITLITVLATAVLIYVIISKLVIGPIQRLEKGALAVAQGSDDLFKADLSASQHMTARHDEIGSLARSLNEMHGNLQQANRKLHHIAYHDNLTGLSNRHMFGIHLQHNIAHAQRHNLQLALLFIDIDGFKEVNDTLGHESGDRVLRDIAHRLKDCLRSEDILVYLAAQNQGEVEIEGDLFSLSRIGGDEFSVILSGLRHPEDAAIVAERTLQQLAPPFDIDNQLFHLGASIGISVYPDDTCEASVLLKNSDIAMYQAKAQGKNTFEFYDHAMTRQAMDTHALLNDMRQCLESGGFTLHYQAQITSHNQRIVGCEALLRWQHPTRGFISPAEFIPLAEDSGLIIPLGEWVLNQACRQNRAWQKRGLSPISMAVNFSSVQFNKGNNIVETVSKALKFSGMKAQQLDIEITESGIMQSGQIAIDTLKALKALGVHISMDDFGTGYSSLAALRDLPIDKIKIDKSFIDGIPHIDSANVIVKAILAMTKQLGYEVVAEGVEEDRQLAFLRNHACEQIQGYYFSRPLPADEFAELLKQNQEVPY